MAGRGRETRAGHSLSLIIPAYNEEAGIRAAVREADEALERLTAIYEVLIVDDGSTDATAEVAASAAWGRPNVRVLSHRTNRGYGAALRTGFEAARFDRVAFTDADCQFHLDDLAPLLALTEHYSLAVGYRLNRQDPWQRRFYSWGYNVLVRRLLGTRVRDCDCALKVFRKEVLANLLPEARGFFVNTEMLTRARQLGYAVAEVGVRHRPRRHGRSSVRLSDIPRTLAHLLPFWWSQVLFRKAPAIPTPRGLPGEAAWQPNSAGRNAAVLSVVQARFRLGPDGGEHQRRGPRQAGAPAEGR
jgi:dolichol-phosphate mannosyltransferase